MIDLNVTNNGQTLMISVSNRQKPSGLQGASFNDAAPGFMVRAAMTLNNDGPKAAADELNSSAQDFLDAAERTRIEMKQLPDPS